MYVLVVVLSSIVLKTKPAKNVIFQEGGFSVTIIIAIYAYDFFVLKFMFFKKDVKIILINGTINITVFKIRLKVTASALDSEA